MQNKYLISVGLNNLVTCRISMFTSMLLNPCLSLHANPCNVTMHWLRGNPVCLHAFASALKRVCDYSLREQELTYHALFPKNSKLFYTRWTYDMDSL